MMLLYNLLIIWCVLLPNTDWNQTVVVPFCFTLQIVLMKWMFHLLLALAGKSAYCLLYILLKYFMHNFFSIDQCIFCLRTKCVFIQ
jgi:hypothetical protein